MVRLGCAAFQAVSNPKNADHPIHSAAYAEAGSGASLNKCVVAQSRAQSSCVLALLRMAYADACTYDRPTIACRFLDGGLHKKIRHDTHVSPRCFAP